MSLAKRATAEALGTGLLLATVVGSGIMGQELSGGNTAIALLANTLATGAALVALILTFGPVSGAHFNPAVTLADAMEGGIPWKETPVYFAAQLLGAVGGTVSAHAMFKLPLMSLSHHVRSGPSQIFSEFVATFGLLSVIWGCSRLRSDGRLRWAISQRRTGSRRRLPSQIRRSRLLGALQTHFRAFVLSTFPDLLSPNSSVRWWQLCCFAGWCPIFARTQKKL